MDAATMTGIAYACHNLDKEALVSAGVMQSGKGGNDWSRFNRDVMGFVLRLDGEKLEAFIRLCAPFIEQQKRIAAKGVA